MADIFKIETQDDGRFVLYEWDDGRWQVERPNRRETFDISPDGTTLTKTEIYSREIETEIYQDTNGDGILERQRSFERPLKSRPSGLDFPPPARPGSYRIDRLTGGGLRVYEWDDRRWQLERPGRRKSFQLSEDGIILRKMERYRRETDVEIYRDPDKDGVFEFQRSFEIQANPRSRDSVYKVDQLMGGQLRVYEWDNRRWQLERPGRRERFQLSKDGSTFLKIESERGGAEIEVYKDDNNDGIYGYVETRFEPAPLPALADPRQLRLEPSSSSSFSSSFPIGDTLL